MLGSISLGKLVGNLKREFCNHIIDCEWLEDFEDGAVMRMWAIDKELVMREDNLRVVCGWFTWLCMDMSTGRFLTSRGLQGMTINSHIDFHSIYRTPEVLVKSKLVDSSKDNYTMLKEIYAGSKLVASGKFVFKVKERNDRQ